MCLIFNVSSGSIVFTLEMASLQSVSLLVFALPLFLNSIIRAEDTAQGPIVACKSGTIQGNKVEISAGRLVNQFLGIPYAEAPVGELRFAAPKPIKPWSGVKQATKYGPSCPQNLVNMTIVNMTWNMEVSGKNFKMCLVDLKPVLTCASKQVIDLTK